MAQRKTHFLARDDLTEDEIAARYRQGARQDSDDEDGMAKDDINAKNARLLDAQKDPKVWLVKVANGTEKTVVMQMMCKWHSLTSTAAPVNIVACYSLERAGVGRECS